jgi:hypothetical protein
MNNYAEFLAEIDSQILAQTNSYNVMDCAYTKIDDNNQRQYNGHYVNFDNINIAPSQLDRVHHFSEQFVVLNYEVTLDLTNATFKQANVTNTYKAYTNGGATAVPGATQVTGADVAKLVQTTSAGVRVPSKRAFRLKGSHHLVDNCQMTLGGASLSRNTNFQNVFIEQNLKKMSRQEYERMSDALQYVIDDQDSYELTMVNNKYIEQGNLPKAEHAKRVYKGQQDRVTASEIATLLNNYVATEYQERIYLKSQTDTQMVFNCYTPVPLKYVHDSVGRIPSMLTINGYRLVLQLNIGESNSWEIEYALVDPDELANVDFYAVESVKANQPVGRTCPFLVSKAGPNTKVQNDLVMMPNADNLKMKLTVSAKINPSSSLPNRIYIPNTVYNDLSFIRNESKARILYDDIFVESVLGIASGAPCERKFPFEVNRPRYLFIIPQLADAVVHPYMSPVNSAPVTCCPHRMSQFQLQIGGIPVFVEQLKYGFQFYDNYLQFMGSDRDGNSFKADDLCNLITRDMFDLNYGVIVIDLKRVLNENLDTASKQIHVSFRNDSGATMNYQFIISTQFEIAIDRITCTTTLPQKA